MKSSIQFLFVAAALTAPCASASDARNAPEQAQVGVSTLGYVFDPDVKGIRPVLGTPGASVVGNPLYIGLSMASAAISPMQDFAVLVGSEDAAVRILSLQDGDPNLRLLAQAVNRPKQIVFSPSGLAVGFYQADSARLQIFTHIHETPVLSHEISTAGLTGNLLSTVISDDGDVALILTGDRSSSTTWLSLSGADPVPLTQAPRSAVAIEFRSGSHDVVVATMEGKIVFVRDIDTSPSFRVLLPADARASDAVAVRFSLDGSRAYVTTKGGAVTSIDSQTGSAEFISCGCAPSGLFPFRPNTLLRLNDFSNSPLMLLDTSQLELHVWFVPALISDKNSERVGQ